MEQLNESRFGAISFPEGKLWVVIHTMWIDLRHNEMVNVKHFAQTLHWKVILQRAIVPRAALACGSSERATDRTRQKCVPAGRHGTISLFRSLHISSTGSNRPGTL